MSGCCYADEYGRMFSERVAQRTARRFQRRGLRGSARTLTDIVAATGIAGAAVLEVGGGVGGIHVDLLRRGAGSATNVELSPGWEAAAAEVLTADGLRDRVRRLVGDFVEIASDLPDFDVVILHRVICCYPDWRGMLDAATSRARRLVAITVPVDHWASRAAVGAGNLLLRMQSRSFRSYVHPPGDMIATLVAEGFRVVYDGHGPVWRTFVVSRGTAGAKGVEDRRQPAA